MTRKHSPLPNNYDEFESWLFPNKQDNARNMAFFTAILYICYAWVEYHMQLPQGELRLVFHGFIIPCVVLSAAVMSCHHIPKSLGCVFQVFLPVIAVLSNLLLNAGTRYFPYFSAEIYLNIIWTFTMSGLSFRFGLISALLSAFSTVIVTFTVYPLTEEIVFINLLWLVSAFTFGFITALNKERSNRQLYLQQKELAYSANTDALTGLWNRRKIEECFSIEAQEVIKKHSHLCVIMLDIDYFKQVNDTYGHNVGDRVLVCFSHLMQDTLKRYAYIGRIGGEEFCILLPSLNLDKAQHIAEKLRKELNRYEFPEVGHISVSIGITEYIAGDTFSNVLSRADSAMYQAKQSGRNNSQIHA